MPPKMSKYIYSHHTITVIIAWVFLGISVTHILPIVQLIASCAAILASLISAWFAIEKRYIRKDDK